MAGNIYSEGINQRTGGFWNETLILSTPDNLFIRTTTDDLIVTQDWDALVFY